MRFVFVAVSFMQMIVRQEFAYWFQLLVAGFCVACRTFYCPLNSSRVSFVFRLDKAREEQFGWKFSRTFKGQGGRLNE